MLSFHGFTPGGGYNSNSDALKDIVPPPPAVTQSSAAGQEICPQRRSEPFCNVSVFHFSIFFTVCSCFFQVQGAQGMAVDPADRRSEKSKGVDQFWRGPCSPQIVKSI